MKWTTRNGQWLSEEYALERQRLPLSLTGGRQEYRYEVTREGRWVGFAPNPSDAKRYAEAHDAQLRAGIIPGAGIPSDCDHWLSAPTSP